MSLSRLSLPTDPIVDEVRAIRDAIASEHNYDINALFETFRRMEAASGLPHEAPPATNRLIADAVLPEKL
jgi:hypothetical protein